MVQWKFRLQMYIYLPAGSFIVDDLIIAIIDDDVLVRESVQRLVRSMGFRAEQFSSEQEFLASPSLAKYCCIISDVNGATGIATQLHRRLPSIGHDIPIIFMTARLDQSTENMLTGAGVVHVLAKPFQQIEMSQCIAAALQRTHAARNPALPSAG